MSDANAKPWGIPMPDRRFWRCLGRVETTRKNGRKVLCQKWQTPCTRCGEAIVLIKPAPRGDQPSVPFQRSLCNPCSRIDAAEKRKATWSIKRVAREAAERACPPVHGPVAVARLAETARGPQRAAQRQAAAPASKPKTSLQKMIDGDYNRPYADDVVSTASP